MKEKYSFSGQYKYEVTIEKRMWKENMKLARSEQQKVKLAGAKRWSAAEKDGNLEISTREVIACTRLIEESVLFFVFFFGRECCVLCLIVFQTVKLIWLRGSLNGSHLRLMLFSRCSPLSEKKLQVDCCCLIRWVGSRWCMSLCVYMSWTDCGREEYIL